MSLLMSNHRTPALESLNETGEMSRGMAGEEHIDMGADDPECENATAFLSRYCWQEAAQEAGDRGVNGRSAESCCPREVIVEVGAHLGKLRRDPVSASPKPRPTDETSA